ncbi:MAG: DUF4097 family beta strand repeat-containing protein [Planctomycetota bacterium]
MRKSFHLICLCLTVGALAIFITGCSFRGGWNSSTPSHKYEKTLEVTAPMSANRAFCATTTNGNIKVLGSEESNCTVTAKITAYGWSDEEAKAVADQVKITIVETDKKTDVVVHKPDIELQKHIGIGFDISIPGNSSLNLTTVNGNVTSSDVAGPVEIRTINGNVSCRDVAQNVKANTTNGNIDVICSADADSIKTVQAKTINGAIKFKSPNNYSVRVDASTFNGAVHSDIPISVKGKIKRNRLNGVIGQGKGTLHLRTINGVIFIQ